MGIFDKLKRKKTEKAPEKDAKQEVATQEESKPSIPEAPKDAIKASNTSRFANKILIEPVITEKSLQRHSLGQYSFYVATDANKHQVKMAIEELYGVKPAQIRMIKNQPIKLYRGGKKSGVQKASKKAIVTMPKGTTINLTE